MDRQLAPRTILIVLLQPPRGHDKERGGHQASDDLGEA